MTNTELIKLKLIRQPLLDALSQLERLEGVEGVEQTLVTPTRSGEVPGDVEQRSVERPRVTPELAEAAIKDVVAKLRAKAAECRNPLPRFMGGARLASQITDNAAAAAFHHAANIVLTLLPEPVNEAVKHLGATQNDPMHKMPKGIELPKNERSGRRNALADPATGGKL